jgi:alpha-glucuronidase
MKGSAFLAFTSLGLILAEDGLNAWLRYAPLEGVPSALLAGVPSSIVVLDAASKGPLDSAGSELKKGIAGILGKEARIASSGTCDEGTIVVGTAESYKKACGDVPEGASTLEGDGFWLSTMGNETVRIIGKNGRGALYGAFEYLSMLAQGNFNKVEYATNPAVQIRWANHWDNLNADIERGYAGPSLFWSGGSATNNMERISQYGRLLASIKVNGISMVSPMMDNFAL